MNTYFQWSREQGLGLGGGGGCFGLFLGEDFASGTTGRQANHIPFFGLGRVSNVEVWGFTTAESEVLARMALLKRTLRNKYTSKLRGIS
ncbi:unnamed protein product [Phaeothamnion confervicola]